MRAFIIKILPLLVLLSQGVDVLYAQDHSEIDSLKSQLYSSRDTARVDILFHLSMAYQYYQPDSAMAYGIKALREAKDLKYAKGQADALINLGRLKRDQGNYNEALEDIFASLKIYKSIRDSVQIGNAFNDISIVYAYSGDYKQSLKFFQQALELFQKTGNEKGVAHALNNIGLIYLDLGDQQKAEEYMLRSLAIKQKRNDQKDLASAYANLGSVMEEIGKEKKAEEYYLKANTLFQQTNNNSGLASNCMALANLYMSRGNLEEAQEYAIRGYDIAKEMDSNPLIESTSGTLVKIAELREDYQSAFNYQKINSAAKDSLYNETSARHLEELKARFNAEEREREIILLKKDQEIQKATMRQKDILAYSLTGGIVLSLVILFLLFVAYRVNKNKKELLAFKNSKIRSQREDLMKLNRDKDQLFSIISHDIKSPLNSLRGFSHLLIHHVDKLSKDEIREMGSTVNHSLENLNELLDNLLAWSIRQSRQNKLQMTKVDINELIEKNIQLYSLTASSKQIKFVNASEHQVYALADYNSVHTILRNLISNAIKFSYPKGEIIIKTFYQEDEVKVSVEDQGVGMTGAAMEKLFDLKGKESQRGTSNEKGSGFGLVLCLELVKENHGTLEVKSEVRKGSEFIFTLPKYVG